MLPFSLLEGDDSFSITHPFSGFRFCVINHVLAPNLLPLISVTYPMDIRKAHTVPYNELCRHLGDSLAPSVHTLLSNPAGPGQFCALPSESLALWQCQQLNRFVLHSSSVVHHAWCPGHYLSRSVLPLLKAMHCICLFSWYYTYCTPYTLTNWQWIVTGATHITHKNQNILHTSKSAMVPADHPSLI